MKSQFSREEKTQDVKDVSGYKPAGGIETSVNNGESASY